MSSVISTALVWVADAIWVADTIWVAAELSMEEEDMLLYVSVD